MSAAYIPSQLSELTGTITTSSVSDFAEGVDDRVNALLVAGTGITLTYNDASGTMTIASTGGGASPPFSGGTANPLVKDAADATKRAAFDAASIATATTRTYLLPDVSGTIALNGSTAVPLSSPTAGGSERFGAGATAAGGNSVVVGGSASSAALDAVAVGYGGAALAAATGGISIGYSSSVSHSGGIMLGYAGATTTANQFMIGSTTIGIGLMTVIGEGTSFALTPRIKSSTSAARDSAKLAFSLATATDASRMGRLAISACDASGTDREAIRVESSGTAAMLSFFGGTVAAKPTVSGSKGGNAAVTSLLSALAALGLITDSTT